MKILVIKLSALGDIIHTYPAIEALKIIAPDAQIDWVVEKNNQILVERYPGVSRAIAIDTRQIRPKTLSKTRPAIHSLFSMSALFDALTALRKERYDLIFDFQGNCKSAICTLLAKGAEKIGWGKEDIAERPAHWAYSTKFQQAPLSARARNRALVERYFQQMTITSTKLLEATEDEARQVEQVSADWKQPILVFPGAQWKNKRYPLDKLIECLEITVKRWDKKIIFIPGSDGERQQLQSLKIPFNHEILSIPHLVVLQHLMKKSCLVLGMDSMPLHLAEAAHVPVFGLFGPTNKDVYLPQAGVSSQGEMDLQGGGVQGTCPYSIVFTRRCPRLRNCPTGACIRDITPHEAAEALFKVLQPRENRE